MLYEVGHLVTRRTYYVRNWLREVSSIVLSRWIAKVDELMTSLPRHRGLAIGHRDRVRRGLG